MTTDVADELKRMAKEYQERAAKLSNRLPVLNELSGTSSVMTTTTQIYGPRTDS
jgi:hypothetical protein